MRKPLAFILCFLAWNIVISQDLENLIQKVPYDSSMHYPVDPEPAIPIDVGPDLDNSFPQLGALFGTLIPEKYFKWKSDLYERTGIKLGFSYQTMFTCASEVSQAGNEQSGWVGWFLVEGQWKNGRSDHLGDILEIIDTSTALDHTWNPVLCESYLQHSTRLHVLSHHQSKVIFLNYC